MLRNCLVKLLLLLVMLTLTLLLPNYSKESLVSALKLAALPVLEEGHEQLWKCPFCQSDC